MADESIDLKRISALSTEATRSDWLANTFFAVDNASIGTKKLAASILVTILNNFAKEFKSDVACVAGKCYWKDGVLYKCKNAHSGTWSDNDFDVVTVDDIKQTVAYFLGVTATDADFTATNFVAMSSASGQKKVPLNLLAKASDVVALQTKTDDTLSKLTRILKCGANLLDLQSLKSGFYINSSGTENAYAAYSVTDYIEVEPSTGYYCSCKNGIPFSASSNTKIAFYAADYSFISVISATDTAITTPETCKFIRASIDNSRLVILPQIKEGTVLTPFEVFSPIDEILTNESALIGKFGKSVYDVLMPLVSTPMITWNDSAEVVTWETGKYYISGGSTGNNANYAISGKVDVEGQAFVKLTPSSQSSTSDSVYDIFYDASGNIISEVQTKTLGEVIKIPYGCKYARFSIRHASASLYFARAISYNLISSVELLNTFSNVLPQVTTNEITWKTTPENVTYDDNYYYSISTGAKLSYTSNYKASQLVDVSSVRYVKVFPVPNITNRNVGYTFYNASNAFISGVFPLDFPDGVIIVPSTAKYMGITALGDTPDLYFPQAIEVKYDRVDKLEERVKEIEDGAVESGWKKNAIRIYPATQMAAFAFTWDDGPAADDDLYTLFSAKNAKCGFALPCSSYFLNGRAVKYRQYQKDGFSCLNHTGDNLSTYANEAAAQVVVSYGKIAMENFGIMINGWICPGNNYVTEYRSMLGKFHGYAYGDHGNGEGTDVNDVNTRSQDILRLRRWDIEPSRVTTQAVKDLIDLACENGYFVTFYGHGARVGTEGYHELSWYEEIIDYIQAKQSNGLCFFGSPDECVQYYFGL